MNGLLKYIEMMEKKDIVVVIPVYKTTLTKYEEMSLNQCV